MTESKNNKAWRKIFEEYQIINKLKNSGQVVISSNYINKIGGRESRLMTKFDHKSQLPELFLDNNLSILPISRGSYIIGSFETFHSFTNDDIKINKIDFPTFLESLDHENITSEAIAINCAFVSRIIQDFTGEDSLYPTVNGRMSSSYFNFNINSKVHKKVRPIFLVYTNGIFHLREYVFNDKNYYNSIELINQKRYQFQDTTINIETIQKILNNSAVVSEPAIPFPQADSFERVINLCELLKQKNSLTKEEITQNYNFVPRQATYYSDAGKYLELIECNRQNSTTVYCLTAKGQDIFNLSIFDRQIEFIRIILAHSVFRDVLKMYFKTGQMPVKREVVAIMRNSSLWNINAESTYERRYSTIVSWINWIISMTEE